jgi:glycosyltransferase involved in cell wall biosynthesis
VGETPKFSIVTPSYNQAAFIAETIESVLSQEGEFEIEYFVMDGGSTDGSVEIIKSYADRVAAGEWPMKCAGISMAWVSQRDKGQSDAINQGLRQATGDIASYINSDDLYYPGAFQRVAEEFAAHPEVDFVYGDGDVIDEAGNLQWEWLSRPYNHAVMTSYHFLWNDFTNYIMQQATFWRRNVLNKIGYFDESFHYAMDVEYWIRAGQASLKLHHTPHKLGKFRLIQGTKSLSNPTVFWEDYLEIYRRYRGSRALGIFFAYYYYNLARQFDFDWAQTVEKGQQVLIRWQTLPAQEQQIIAQQAERGFALACLLLASELRRQQRYEKAAITFRKGLANRPFLVLHPLALGYLLKCMAGPRLSSMLDKWAQRMGLAYRRVRFDYRYYQKNA